MSCLQGRLLPRMPPASGRQAPSACLLKRPGSTVGTVAWAAAAAQWHARTMHHAPCIMPVPHVRILALCWPESLSSADLHPAPGAEHVLPLRWLRGRGQLHAQPGVPRLLGHPGRCAARHQGRLPASHQARPLPLQIAQPGMPARSYHEPALNSSASCMPVRKQRQLEACCPSCSEAVHCAERLHSGIQDQWRAGSQCRGSREEGAGRSSAGQAAHLAARLPDSQP